MTQRSARHLAESANLDTVVKDVHDRVRVLPRGFNHALQCYMLNATVFRMASSVVVAREIGDNATRLIDDAPNRLGFLLAVLCAFAVLGFLKLLLTIGA